MGRGVGGGKWELEEKRDTELTLGPGRLALIGGGLLVLCGLCIALGYSIGRRSSPALLAANTLPASALQSPAPSIVAQTKPQAAGNSSVQPAPEVPTDSTTDATPEPDATQGAQSAAQPGSANTVPAQLAVRTALPGQPVAAAPSAPQVLTPVQPALSPAAGTMVQIATFAHPEDAQVLVDALRRRGYPVGIRRDPYDGSMHVQVGPFSNRNDANAIRQRLLNDGYNAIVLN